MQIKSRAPTETIQPDWLGNLELPEHERVTVTFRLLTVGEANRAEARRVSWALKKKRNQMAAVGASAADAPMQLLRSHVTEVKNLTVESPDGKQSSPSNGEELAAVIESQPGERVWSELANIIIEAIRGESALEEGAGNGSASSPAS